MKKLIFLLILCSCSSLKTSNLSNDNFINDNQNKSLDVENKKCINEFLLPCSSINKSENKIIADNVKKRKKSSSKNIILSSKDVSINDLPKSDLNQKISFDKYKSSVIKYSIKSDYPDINK